MMVSDIHMEPGALLAIVIAVSTAGSTAGVAIAPLVLSDKRFELLERPLDRISGTLEEVQSGLTKSFGHLNRLKERTGLF